MNRVFGALIAGAMVGGAATTAGVDLLVTHPQISAYLVHSYCDRVHEERRFRYRRDVNVAAYPHTIEITCNVDD